MGGNGTRVNLKCGVALPLVLPECTWLCCVEGEGGGGVVGKNGMSGHRFLHPLASQCAWAEAFAVDPCVGIL